MPIMPMLAMVFLAAGPPASAFDVRTELQAIYDEISQATLQFSTASDVDLFHDVTCAPDWVFIDASGHSEPWPVMRERAIRSLSEPYPDSIIQMIQKLSLTPEGATAVVGMTTVRTVDREGSDGRQGAGRTVTETSVFRDSWVRVADAWKLKSRQQVGGPATSADKAERGTS